MEATEQRATTIVQRVLWILAALACAGAVLRVVMSQKEWLERLDATTLTYLAVAAALIVLHDLKSLAFGDYKIEFYDRLQQAEERAAQAQALATQAEERATQAAELAHTATSVSLFGVGKAPAGSLPAGAQAMSSKEASFEAGKPVADPWRGAFGGQAESRNRVLRAGVTPVAGSADFFNLKLRVVSTQPQNDPLRGEVQFFLHDTFRNDRPVVLVNAPGVAELNLVTYGAFTVGAIADGGKTKLELDLATLPDAPADFCNR